MDDRHYLIGTAGHVDHGKTKLIRALTGIETDRLKEEQQRGISIELGFAHLKLPSGREVGIVDVPGHEKFVRQMLAGATGMDMVLLVIAADEGIMPQTREHLDILTLLGVSRGIVVLNKKDLVDGEWLELIQEEIREGLKGTVFENAPLYPVSAQTGEGINELKSGIDQMLNTVQSKAVSGPVRLPIDRIFSIQGFGTVVTGTLHSGTIVLGQEVAIEPGHKVVKVRSLQVHNEKVEQAEAGQRVAINLAGVDTTEIEKGAVVITPGAFPIGNILDLKVHNLASMDKPLIQRQRVRFHIGTVEILGRVHLLEHEEISPGQEGYIQILLEEPVVVASQDRFVLRFYSPAYTIAGGKVLGVAESKKKRFNEQLIAQMRLKDQGDPLVLLERELCEPHTLKELEGTFHFNVKDIQDGLNSLLEKGRIEAWVEDTTPLYWQKESAELWRNKLLKIVKTYEASYPLRGGIGREELKTKLGVKWAHRRWQNILEEGAERNYFNLVGSKVQTVDKPSLPEMIQRKLDCLRKNWQAAGLASPDLESGALECGINKMEVPDYVLYLVENGEWVTIEGNYIAKESLEAARQSLVNLLEQNGEVTVGDVRDIWGISRKYLVPLLEYFDQQKVTRRQGDKRVLYR
jgi:selenocysteine-specific elongation factor